MDLAKIIQDLTEEKAKLEQVLATLEDLQQNAVPIPAIPARRRGRHGMPATERAEVSLRMKRYWAGRRSATQDVAVRA